MNRVFAFILIFAMIAGIAAGWFVNSHYPAARAAEIAENLSILTDLFLRLIKMIIAPLVFATLVAGIAHMEDRSEEHTSELQSLMRISYAVYCLKKNSYIPLYYCL